MCQFTDEKSRSTLADYIRVPGVYAAGRLDYDSEGLVVLTDNGRLQALISQPKFKMTKIYWVQVEGRVSPAAIQQLRDGVLLNDGPTLPAQVELMAEPKIWPRDPPIRVRLSIPTSWLQIGIKEGRNRQIRRMTAAVGHPTLRLVRYAVGDWNLDGLLPGQYRELETEGAGAPELARPYTRQKKRRTPGARDNASRANRTSKRRR